MIIRRKLTKFPPENLPLKEQGKRLSMVSANEFINETYEFLKTFYRGCFDAYRITVGYKTLFICIENFATVIKGLVKSVFGREVIIIKFDQTDDKLLIEWEFDTSVVSEEKRKEMKQLANEGGFDITFGESLALIELEFVPGALPYVNSHSTRIVYNTLVYIFSSPNI